MITEDILVKYLAGEAEPHEVAMIEKWRSESDANEKHFRQLQQLWDGSEGLKETQKVNTDAAWNSVRARLHTQPKGRNVLFNTSWLLAASLALLIGIGVIFMTRNTADTKMLTLQAAGKQENVRLSDGSSLIVKSGQLSYPEEFSGGKRKVKLLSGKVFFDIASDKKTPFEIEANATTVTVLGTEFEVVSYTDYTQVMVKEGKVKFATPAGETILTAGMGAKYMQKENRMENTKVESRNAFAYTTGTLVFENTKLSDVVEDINRFYDAEISLESATIADCTITSSFPGETLENVLEVVAGTLSLEIEHVPNSNKIILKGKECRP